MIGLSACVENNITTPSSDATTPQMVLSAPANPVMYVHPGEFFQNSVTVVAPIGVTPALGFGIDGAVQVTGADIVNYGSVGCTENCKTNTWKWTLYFQAPSTEGSYTGTFHIEGTALSSHTVVNVSWKG
jgi:hypothetical protein